jgi:hypothetical protein
LVTKYHYAKGASNTAVHLHGLYPHDWHWYAQCIGVAWWIPPTKSAAQAWAGDKWEGVLSLSRLVIQPNSPRNACSFLLSKSVRLIDRKRWHTLVTYADKWRGHRKHVGVEKTGGKAMPGTTRSRFKKGFDGIVRDRETGEPIGG